MKKSFSLLLALLMLLCLTACGQNPQTEEPTPVPAATVWYSESTISVTAEQIDAILNGEFETPKNVIILIGDGMGPNVAGVIGSAIAAGFLLSVFG